MCSSCTQAATLPSDHWPGQTKAYSHEQCDLSKIRIGGGGVVLERAFTPLHQVLISPKVFQSLNSNPPLKQWPHCPKLLYQIGLRSQYVQIHSNPALFVIPFLIITMAVQMKLTTTNKVKWTSSSIVLKI